MSPVKRADRPARRPRPLLAAADSRLLRAAKRAQEARVAASQRRLEADEFRTQARNALRATLRGDGGYAPDMSRLVVAEVDYDAESITWVEGLFGKIRPGRPAFRVTRTNGEWKVTFGVVNDEGAVEDVTEVTSLADVGAAVREVG